MKVALAETNKTLITIILIAIIGATGGILVKVMMDNTTKNKCCEDQNGVWVDSKCYKVSSCAIGSDGKLACEESGYIKNPCAKTTTGCASSDGVWCDEIIRD